MSDPHAPNADIDTNQDTHFSHNPLTPAAEVDSAENFDIEADASGSSSGPGREGGTPG